MHRPLGFFFATCWLASTVVADTLTFVAQVDHSVGATNYSWFAADNWFEPDGEGSLLPAGRVPLANETAIITGFTDVGSTGIRIRSLILTNHAFVNGGTIAVERVHMAASSGFSNSTVNVLTELDIQGPDCRLSGGILTLLGIASAGLRTGAAPAGLEVGDGAILSINGTLTLHAGTSIKGVSSSGAKLALSGTLLGAGDATVSAIDGSRLTLDNSGIIRADAGVLSFQGDIDWQCSGGLAQFEAAQTNGWIDLRSPLAIVAATTSQFTGPGLHVFRSGALVDGTMLIGAPGESNFVSGAVMDFGSLKGTGTIQVQGIGTNGSVMTWAGGTLSVPMSVQKGASLRIESFGELARTVSGVAITNLGSCVMSNAALSFESEALFHNSGGAIFEIHNNASFTRAGGAGTGTFRNDGRFKKMGQGSAAFEAMGGTGGVHFNNFAFVEVLEGELGLSDGVSAGDFTIATNAILAFSSGIHVLQAGVDLTGPGAVHVGHELGSAKVSIAGRTTARDLQIRRGGTLAGSGPTTPSLDVQVLSIVDQGIARDLGVYAEQLHLATNAMLTNLAASVRSRFSVSGSNSVMAAASVTTGSGSLGQLGTPETPTHLRLKSASSLNLSGSTTFAQSSVIEGDDSSVLKIMPGGVLAGSGTLLIAAENRGTVVPADAFTIGPGRVYRQHSSGKLVVSFHNTPQGVRIDTLNVLGEARLDGTMTLDFEGFPTPPIGTFTVLSYGSHQGEFGSFSGEAPVGSVWLTTYKPTSLELSLQRKAEVGPATLTNGSFGFLFPTVAGSTYTVQVSNDLGRWTTLRAVQGDGSVHSISEVPGSPRAFYRVLVQ